jgi:branched-chain amino acid transport system ATP-binding protein
MALLEVRGLTKSFGGLVAVSDLDLDINQGEILGLIGPNGAGKTTVFNLISGFLRPDKGKITFKGRDITSLKPNKIADLGLVRTFQFTTCLLDQTVSQNISMGSYLGQGLGFFRSVFDIPSARKAEERIQQRTREVSEHMGLVGVREELAANISYGIQKKLGVAIALATNPALIMLDEPVTGMTATETADVMKRIQLIRSQGKAVLLVEHDMRAVMNTCDRIIVLNFGKKIADDVPSGIKENKSVIESYLGAEEDE